MAKKNDVVSVGAWERIRKECGANDINEIDWHGERLTVRRLLSFAEAATFVSLVVADCFSENKDEYHPEAKEFSVARCMIYFYTNLRLPTDVEKQYDLIYGTDILEVVAQYADNEQGSMIRNAIDERIDVILDANRELIQREMAKLSDTIDQFSSIFDGVRKEDIEAITKAAANGIDEGKIMQAFLAQKGASQGGGNGDA